MGVGATEDLPSRSFTCGLCLCCVSQEFYFCDSSLINIAFTVAHCFSVTDYRENLGGGGGADSGLPNLGEGNKICVQTTSSEK